MKISTAPVSDSSFHTREAGLFVEHYSALQQRTGMLLPPRKALVPSATRALLPYLAILEAREPGTILVRLVGTAVINRGRVDMTGHNLLDFYPPAQRQHAWAHYMRMLETPCGCTLLAQESYEHVMTYSELVNFPLSDETGKGRFIIGIAVEVDRKDLMLRGDGAMQIESFSEPRYLDIGAGI